MYFRDSKFIISCAARSGSTMLVHLLRSHPDIICHGEVFTKDGLGRIHGIYTAKRKADSKFDRELYLYSRKDPGQFLYDIVFDSQGYKLVGFKFKLDEAFNRNYKRIANILASDKSIKIIHLIRRNLLDQYISHQVVLKQTGITLLHDDKKRPEVSPFEINISHCLSYAKKIRTRQRDAEKLYGEHRSHTVYYEDLVGKGQESFRGLLEYLGVENKVLTTSTKKILEDSSQIILNYEEASKALAEEGIIIG